MPTPPPTCDTAKITCGPAGAGPSLVRVGVTDFAQQSLGDVVAVTLPGPGDAVKPVRPAATSSRSRASAT